MRRRLVLLAAATTAMVALAFVVPLAVMLRTFAHERAMSLAAVEVRALAPLLAETIELDPLAAAVSLARNRIEGQVTVFLPGGRVIGDPAPVDANVASARSGRALTVDVDGGRSVFVPVVRSNGSVAVVRGFVPDAVLNRGVLWSWGMLAGLAATLVAGAVLMADRLARSTVTSVRELEKLAIRLGEGDLAARGDIEDPSELVAVQSALHTLTERIQEFLASEREAAADLSHRLRTPLTALRIDAAELPASPQAERLQKHVEDLEGAVNAIIRGVRVKRPGGPARTDLVETVRRRTRFWEVIAAHQRRDWNVDLPATSQEIVLPADELEAVVDALLNNALTHTPEGTAISVTVGNEPDAIVLEVADDGPGLPPGAIRRGRSDAGSTGLGLDIVRRAARATGGDLHVSNRPEGGACVEVRFERPRRAAKDGSGKDRKRPRTAKSRLLGGT